MTIEIEETKLQNLNEQIEELVKVIKRYDDAIKIKNSLIKELEKEVSLGKESIMLLLIALENNAQLTEHHKMIIEEIKNTL